MAASEPAGRHIATRCGGSTAGVLSPSNQFRYYTLATNAGDTLRVIFTRISENFSPQIEIFYPVGARIAANSDVTQKAAAGNYLVVVSPSTSVTETGAYSVAFQRPNNPCSPVSLTCGQTTLRQVNLPGQLDTFSFKATGGDQTTMVLASRSGAYSPFVEMYNPAGALLSTSSNGLLRRVLPADGVYTLLVRDRTGLDLGSYRVSLQDDSNTCPVTDTEGPSITLLRPTGGEVLPGGTTLPSESSGSPTITSAWPLTSLRCQSMAARPSPTRSPASAATCKPMTGSCPPKSHPPVPPSSASPPPMRPATRNPPPATC